MPFVYMYILPDMSQNYFVEETKKGGYLEGKMILNIKNRQTLSGLTAIPFCV